MCIYIHTPMNRRNKKHTIIHTLSFRARPARAPIPDFAPDPAVPLARYVCDKRLHSLLQALCPPLRARKSKPLTLRRASDAGTKQKRPPCIARQPVGGKGQAEPVRPAVSVGNAPVCIIDRGFKWSPDQGDAFYLSIYAVSRPARRLLDRYQEGFSTLR